MVHIQQVDLTQVLQPLCSSAPAVLNAPNVPASIVLGTFCLPANTQPAEPAPTCSAICLPQPSLPLHQALLSWKHHREGLQHFPNQEREAEL